MSTTIVFLTISNWAFGIGAAVIFGSIIFIVRCGRQCCDSITWIIDMYRRNTRIGTLQKEQVSDAEPSVEKSSEEEISEIKRQISTLSQQIKAMLVEIKKARRTELMKALEGDANTASTEYGMKFELKRPEFEKAMRILHVTLARMPEQAVAYRQDTIKWIAEAQKKFDGYKPEKFVQEIETAKSRRRTTQDK